MNDLVFIHPKAIVESENIGDHTRIWAFAHILKEARIGQNCNICDLVFIENDVVIGNEVTIKSGVYVWDGLRIEDSVFIGPNVTFTNDNFPRSKIYQNSYPKTVIKEGASIGANSVLIAGVVVGRYAMVGAGSVVTKDVNDFWLIYGNPAKLRAYICKCAKKLKLENDKVLVCSCGLKYILREGQIWEV